MDEETGKEEQQATSSKKENLRNTGDEHGQHDVKRKYDTSQKYDERGTDAVSNSVSFTSSYSARSLDVADVRQRGTKGQKKKRSKRLIGKAEKRTRSATRRRIIRKAPKRKPRLRKDRDPSVSTIFTRLTSGSGSQGCNFCGHRCCRRRYKSEKKRIVDRRKDMAVSVKEERRSAKSIQAGSRANMLSPLFINTNSAVPEPQEERMTCSEITPEMIFDSVRKLTMWRQYALTTAIFQYVKLNFPVNPDEMQLMEELEEKLDIAALAEIITKGDEGWCLNCRLQDRYITKNHVTKFWQIYADTLRPVHKRPPVLEPTNVDTTNQGVSANQLHYLINRHDFI
ncbi:uncharacterized protein LOC128677414 [Plodia interpunctella]|uniref:uncharacterized protein LOC128677414 n=1 Tax=Plodia interpunctella TaxID=58824 RepID=UPI0023675A69|nr:uncharacterized protein LOC128677414 [Plodia interpunctella]